MKKFYRINGENEPVSLIEGNFNEISGYTEYTDDEKPDELIEAESYVPESTTNTITVPTSKLLPVSLGGEGDEALMGLNSIAANMGAKISTDTDNGETSFIISKAFISNLPDAIQTLLSAYTN